MGKHLIMTLGTGKGVEFGLSKSIKSLNPDSITFLGSSKSSALLNRLAQLVPDYSKMFKPICFVRDEDDVEACVEDSKNIIIELLDRGVALSDIDVDFTSGTKAMSAGLAVTSSFMEVGRMVYVSGERDPETGRVIKGTERIIIIYPMKINIEQKRRHLVVFFNRRLFEAGLEICKNLLDTCSLPSIKEEFNYWELLFRAYWSWYRFDHIQANKIIKFIPKKFIDFLNLDISGNKEILNRISKRLESFAEASRKKNISQLDLLCLKYSSELLADLVANAIRKAQEGRFDDAVARLYRVVEMVAQKELARKGKDTSRVSAYDIPENLRPFFPELSTSGKSVSIGLDKSFQLLKALDDNRSDQYLENKKLKNFLTHRNNSILAHGIIPVKEEYYFGLKTQTFKLVDTFFPEIKKRSFIDKASFPVIEKIL